MSNFTTAFDSAFAALDDNSLSSLKAFCIQFDIEVCGDRRRKASYFDAVDVYCIQHGVYEGGHDYDEEYASECGDHDAIAQAVDVQKKGEELSEEMAIAEGLIEAAPLTDELQTILDSLTEQEESTSEAVGFAPLVLMFAQVVLGVVMALVFAGVWATIQVAKFLKGLAAQKPAKPSFYQQTKDLFSSEDIWADEQYLERQDRLAIA